MNLYLDLLVRRDGTEDDLCEALSWKHPEADAADDASIFDEGEGLVLSVDVSDVSGERRPPSRPEDGYLRVKHQPGDVLFRHARELVRENVLQTDQPHQDLLIGLLGKRVSNDVKLDDAPPLLQPGRLVACGVWRQQVRLSVFRFAR